MYNMMTYGFGGWGHGGIWGIGFPLLIIWSLAWKGLALWKASHEESKPWFIALLIINTAGILEILSIYAFAKKKGIPTV